MNRNNFESLFSWNSIFFLKHMTPKKLVLQNLYKFWQIFIKTFNFLLYEIDVKFLFCAPWSSKSANMTNFDPV